MMTLRFASAFALGFLLAGDAVAQQSPTVPMGSATDQQKLVIYKQQMQGYFDQLVDASLAAQTAQGEVAGLRRDRQELWAWVVEWCAGRMPDCPAIETPKTSSTQLPGATKK